MSAGAELQPVPVGSDAHDDLNKPVPLGSKKEQRVSPQVSDSIKLNESESVVPKASEDDGLNAPVTRGTSNASRNLLQKVKPRLPIPFIKSKPSTPPQSPLKTEVRKRSAASNPEIQPVPLSSPRPKLDRPTQLPFLNPAGTKPEPVRDIAGTPVPAEAPLNQPAPLQFPEAEKAETADKAGKSFSLFSRFRRKTDKAGQELTPAQRKVEELARSLNKPDPKEDEHRKVVNKKFFNWYRKPVPEEKEGITFVETPVQIVSPAPGEKDEEAKPVKPSLDIVKVKTAPHDPSTRPMFPVSKEMLDRNDKIESRDEGYTLIKQYKDPTPEPAFIKRYRDRAEEEPAEAETPETGSGLLAMFKKHSVSSAEATSTDDVVSEEPIQVAQAIKPVTNSVQKQKVMALINRAEAI
ncbi:MAG: hypothetical protein AAF492_23700, partial [Verrucomicrobiota bacterium]